MLRTFHILFISLLVCSKLYSQALPDQQDIDMEMIDDAQMSASNEDILARALAAFRNRRYARVIEIIQDLDGERHTNSIKYYLKGLSYNRLDDYENAIESFQASLQRGNEAIDIPYEMGQAFYAMNALRRSMSFFQRSYQQGHMKATSLYYLGHISQILDQHREARDYFGRLINEPSADANLVQIARFQRAESLLAMARVRGSEAKRTVSEYVLPEFEAAQSMAKNSRVAGDIAIRIAEIKREFGLDPNVLVNGRQIPVKRWQLDLTQKISYDNNITFANDLPTTQATQADSYIFNTEMLGNYTWVFQRRFVVTPQLRLTQTVHSNRDDSDIYRNDSYTLRPSIRTRTEHTLFERPASFLLNWEYDYIARDREAEKNRKLLSRSHTFTFGQRIQYFSFGETTFRYRKRSYRGFDETIDFDTTSFSLDQVVVLPNRHLLIGLINLDQIRAQTETSSADTLTTRADYLIPNIIPEVTLGLNLTYIRTDNFNDPSKESADGMLMPGINITRRIGKKIRARFSYEHVDVSSDNPLNEYSKHMLGAELRVIF